MNEVSGLLLGILLSIRDRAHRGLSEPFGICHQVRVEAYRLLKEPCYADLVEDNLYKLYRLMDKWPEHSGDRDYPVSDGGPFSPAYQYDMRGPEAFWNRAHPYGAARLRLLDWLIEQLEKENDESRDFRQSPV